MGIALGLFLSTAWWLTVHGEPPGGVGRPGDGALNERTFGLSELEEGVVGSINRRVF
jgi:hypothetical protein